MTKDYEKEKGDREFEYHIRQKLRVSLEKSEEQLAVSNSVIADLRAKLALQEPGHGGQKS